ncbi:GP182 protein, partial [Amia calva]|nr:GP182 protein [Amia calva]
MPWFVYECTLELDVQYRRITLFLLYLLVFVAGLAENGLVVWVNWRRRHSRSAVTFCVLNVCLADLVMVLVLPFYMLEVALHNVWLWGRALCKISHLLYMANFYGGTFFLAYMAVERYLALVQPPPSWGPQEKRRRALVCGGLWALALFLTVLENVHVDLLEWDEPGCYMIPEHSYTEWYTTLTMLSIVFQFLLPGAVIITFNVLLARAVRSAPGVEGRRDTWVVHLYSLVFVLCYLPYHLIMVLLMVDELLPLAFSCNMMEFLYFSYSIMQCLSLFHCIANPILYNFLSPAFRTHLVNALLSHLSRTPAPTNQLNANTNAKSASPPVQEGREIQDSDTSHSDIVT